MYKLISLIFIASLISACSIKEPRVSFGKKCIEKGNSIAYSYVWLYDKETGLYADENTCDKIKKD